MIKVYMMTGLPGSGKSTWWQQFQELNKTDFNKRRFVTLSTDYVIENVCDMYGLEYNKTFPDLIDFAEKALNQKLSDALQHYQAAASAVPGHAYDLMIGWDQTNLTYKSRTRKIARFQSFCGTAGINKREYEINSVFCDTPVDVCIKRRSEGWKRIDPKIILGMRDIMIQPTLEEGFQSILQGANPCAMLA